MDAGTVLHHVLQKWYDGEFQDIEQAKDFFNNEWTKYKLEDTPLKLKKDSYWLMCLNGINLKIKVTSTEMKIYYPEVVAYLDIINTEDDEVVDWKSSTRYEDNELEYKKQLQLYAWLYYRKLGRVPKKCTVHYLKYPGSKGELSFNFTMDDINAVEQWYNIILNEMDKIRTEGVTPMKCTSCHKFCPYNEHCYPSQEGLNVKLLLSGNFIHITGVVPKLLEKGIDAKFSYEFKNAYYMKKANPHARTTMKFWDSRRRCLPIGFLKELLVTLRHYSEYKNVPLNVDIEDKREFYEPGVEMPEEFLNGIKLRDYQTDAVDVFLREKIGILEIGTGGGKSEVAIEIIRRLGKWTLFITDKVELLKQTKKRIEDSLGIEVGVIGQSEMSIRPVTVATIQTINKKLINPDFQNYLKQIRVGIFDECLQGASQIVLPDHTIKRIDEIYKDNNIEEVLSYNETKRIFEPKKILRKIRQPMLDPWYNLLVEDELGGRHKLVLTGNHKIWTTNGYKQVKNLNKKDILKVYLFKRQYQCSLCGKYYENSNQSGYCKAHCKNPDMNKIAAEKSHEVVKEKRNNIEYDLKYRESIKKGIKNIAQKKSTYWINKKMMGSKRRGKNNPVFRHPETIPKIKLTQKKNFHNMTIEKQKEQIKRWNSSFRKIPHTTKPEQIIIDMNISNLEYNGEKKYMYKFKNKKWKIPDFKVVDENKVIEVSDFEHWRTVEEKDNIVELFNQIGIKCLYLDKNELYNNYIETKRKIEKFCYNHKARIIKVKRTRKNPFSFRYNLEIEDNHNYIANNILVSNCHKVAAQSYFKLGQHLVNTEFRLGLSGTAYRDDGNDMKIFATTGYKCYDLSSKTLIEKGWLVKPQITFYKDVLTKNEVTELENNAKTGLINETPNYANYYDILIYSNTPRNNAICEIIKNNNEKKILVLVKLVKHGEHLEVLIPDSKYLHGSTPKKEREQMFNDFTNGELDILISTISIFAEGVDIPSLDMVINASANKGNVKTIQVLGRVLRKMEGKKNAQYIDFIDDSKFFRLASLARKRALIKEGHEVEIRTYSLENITFK